jgi:sporulation protein YabP
MPEKNTRSPQPAPPHDLILEGRARLTVTGVQKVLHCNADSAAIETGRGILHLTGAQLSMAALDLEAGEAKFTGRIDALEYTASAPAGSVLASSRPTATVSSREWVTNSCISKLLVLGRIRRGHTHIYYSTEIRICKI